jgi:hypothetical protein
MRIGRSVGVLTALLAVMLAGTSVAYTQTRSEQQQGPVVKPQDITVEPVNVDATGPDDLFVPDAQTSPTEANSSRDRQSAATALREQVDAEILEARRRTLQLETAFDKVQRQFVENDPGEQAAVPEQVLGRFERGLDELEDRFDRAESGFRALGEVDRAEGARDALDALDTLQGQLGLLGLRLETRGERARVANALELDLELLVESLELLLGPVVEGDREFDDDIIRPPEGIEPSREIIRPAEGIEPSREIIRPAEGIEPSREIIRPAEGVEPSREIIRPAEGVAPSREIIRPAEGVAPSREIIRPPTSDNPAVAD